MAVYLLDTTTITHLRNGHPQITANLVSFRSSASGHTVAIASINVEEVLGGWLSYIQRAKTPQQRTEGAKRLNDSILMLAHFDLIAETESAVARHEALRKMKLNVGRNDLRLAALALELGATIVSDNAVEFGRVPALLWVDWTK